MNKRHKLGRYKRSVAPALPKPFIPNLPIQIQHSLTANTRYIFLIFYYIPKSSPTAYVSPLSHLLSSILTRLVSTPLHHKTMAFNADTVTGHKDAGKHSGTAAEVMAKKVGLGAYGKKIGEFVSKLVGKKQKAMADQKTVAAPAQPAAHTPAAVPVTA
jgi:hypothetical protein